MKLQILIPQFNENDEIIKPLLDSIALQQRVDFNEIGVIICNDGSEVKLSEDFLNSYLFKVEYYQCEHKGVSATRNACLDKATADYVMFCDIDDMFYNMCGLWIIFREMELGFDSLVSVFVEESKFKDLFTFINHEMDSTFVHGKVHRRLYLIDNKIRFNDNLTIHEDSFFNILALNCSENIKYCHTPFYLWKWRDNSVCRHDPKYILKTFNNLIDSNDCLILEFLKRGNSLKAMIYVCSLVFDSYYTMNKPEWINLENKEYRNNVEKRFSSYYKKYKDLWNLMPQYDKMCLSNGIRSRSINEGMMMEAITIDTWLNKIENL